MNHKHQENRIPTDPLIFTVPAYGFVMALYIDWLGRSTREALSAKSFAQEIEPVGAPNPRVSVRYNQ
jgi:hypothetical protein